MPAGYSYATSPPGGGGRGGGGGSQTVGGMSWSQSGPPAPPLGVTPETNLAELEPFLAEVLAGDTSRRPQSHLDAPYSILYGESLMKYKRGRLNDSTAGG